jgi:hypothetical protein
LGHVAGLGGVDADEVPDAFPVFRILPDRDVDAVLVERRCGIDFTGAFGGRIPDRLSVAGPVFWWIRVVTPDGLEPRGLIVLDGIGVESVKPAVAAAEEDEFLAIDNAA